MRTPIHIQNRSYRDEVARRHRRTLLFKIVLGGLGLGAAVVGLVYVLFFSHFFEIREISFSGLDTMSSEEFRSKIGDDLSQKFFQYLPKNNILFVNAGKFEKDFASSHPIFKSVKVEKKFFHGLIFDFVERKPAGIWCFKVDCSYFDADKVLWGRPAKSSGFIFLTIEDKRDRPSSKIDDEFFKPIMEVAKNMSGEIKNIIIPSDSFNEFQVYTAKGYYVILSIDSDIKNQLDILKIFLNEKKDVNFNPQYVDLRIDGRIYYK